MDGRAVSNTEMQPCNFQWQCPAESLRMSCREEIWLAPPQLYELSRLYGLKDFDEVNNYSVEREKDGCERWFPVRFNCQDGIITTLVGMNY